MLMNYHTVKRETAFSLAETLAAIVIGSMILVTVLTIHGRVQRSAASVRQRLDTSRPTSEVLQRIAEDFDEIFAADDNTTVRIENKLQGGYQGGRMIIKKVIRNSDNEDQVFEQIIWQSSFDPASGKLILYRSHTGMVTEDKLLDEQRAGWEQMYPFVPILTGVTCFRAEVPRGQNYLDRWTSDNMPSGVRITLSQAEPVQTVAGTLEVEPEDEIARTIAVDRSRKIGFNVVRKDFAELYGLEPNELPADESPDANAGGVPDDIRREFLSNENIQENKNDTRPR